MLSVVVGVALIFFAVNQVSEIEDVEGGTVHYAHLTPTGPVDEEGVVVEPLAKLKFEGIVRQAYDYSCGSAALTTVYNHFLGYNLQERQVMEGLIRLGDYQRIIERRGFSLLDMKRLSTALGHRSGGFRASIADLKSLEQPAIVPIEYAGFKHFVVVQGYQDERFFIADPSMGNISFTEVRFEEVWSDNVLFMVFPKADQQGVGFELTENDMRYVDDQTIRLVMYRQLPQFTKRLDAEVEAAGSYIEYLIADPENPDGDPIRVETSTRQRFKSK